MSLCTLLGLISPVPRTVPGLIKCSKISGMSEWISPGEFHQSCWHSLPLVFSLVISMHASFTCGFSFFFLNHRELLLLFHSVCFFPQERCQVLPPGVSHCTPACFGLKETRDLLGKEGENACLPACLAFKRADWLSQNSLLPWTFPKSTRRFYQ